MKLNTYDLGLGGGSLLQLATLVDNLRMAYLIDTPDGKTIIIDGGLYCREEADQLYQMIQERGGRVDLWILTHAHSDHIGGLTWMMEHLPVFDITIDKLIYHFPPAEVLSKWEDWENNERFLYYVEKLGLNVVTPAPGDIYECGGVSVEIISISEEYEKYWSTNPTSIIFLVHFPARDVLFLGDFEVWAQPEFLSKYDVSKLRCDIVQMAHHGQAGVDRSFYELIQPKYCLYTAADWIWYNYPFYTHDPAAAGTGPFRTLETRRWMEEMGVAESFTFIEGDWLFT